MNYPLLKVKTLFKDLPKNEHQSIKTLKFKEESKTPGLIGVVKNLKSASDLKRRSYQLNTSPENKFNRRISKKTNDKIFETQELDNMVYCISNKKFDENSNIKSNAEFSSKDNTKLYPLNESPQIKINKKELNYKKSYGTVCIELSELNKMPEQKSKTKDKENPKRTKIKLFSPFLINKKRSYSLKRAIKLSDKQFSRNSGYLETTRDSYLISFPDNEPIISKCKGKKNFTAKSIKGTDIVTDHFNRMELIDEKFEQDLIPDINIGKNLRNTFSLKTPQLCHKKSKQEEFKDNLSDQYKVIELTLQQSIFTYK